MRAERWGQLAADRQRRPAPPTLARLVKAALGPTWGYHLDDVNLALGNLVPDVALEEASYR